MVDLKLSIRKLEGLQLACLKNALRLHFDSILLAKKRSYGSSFAISVIASEELGKACGIAEIIYCARSNGRIHPEYANFAKALLWDHKLKQGWFVRSLFDIFGPRDVYRRYQTIQYEKNNAIYAGVRKGNHHIVRPFLISASKAKKQLRTVNTALTNAVRGTLDGTEYHEEVADQLFRSRRLLRKLMTTARFIR